NNLFYFCGLLKQTFFINRSLKLCCGPSLTFFSNGLARPPCGRHRTWGFGFNDVQALSSISPARPQQLDLTETQCVHSSLNLTHDGASSKNLATIEPNLVRGI
ncbi:MAG: hypothetical protein AAGA75_28740, partial [Cyanobacteria bacterium P01_E01_bin.6]